MIKLFEKLSNGTINEAYTHGGIFHADDVFAAALLRYVNPNISFKRVFNVNNLDPSKDLIFDIGGGEYDHHQEDALLRTIGDDSSKYAAFGLLWDDLGHFILPDDEAYRFDEEFVQIIDKTDNTGEPNILSATIGSLNPNWDSGESPDEAFEKAVAIATALLSAKLDSIKSRLKADSLVEEDYGKSENKEIITLEKFRPWQNILVPSVAKFVIYPSLRGGYNLQTVPVEQGGTVPKREIPESWKVVPPEGMTFCHPNRFLASFSTEAEAYAAAESILR